MTRTDPAPADPVEPTAPADPAEPTAPADPADPAAPATRRPNRMPGNWRSLVISMAIMTAVVFVLVALMPHPAQRERTTVDVARAASQLAVEKRWPLATVRTGEDWHPTTVSFATDAKGVPTWQVGYHHRPGDDRYIVLTQTQAPTVGQTGAGDGVSAEQVTAWVSRQTVGGRMDGTAQVGGVTWSRRTATVDAGTARVRRSLVADGAGAPGGLVTVLSGEVEYADLEAFAGALQLQSVPTGTPSTGSPTAGSATTGSPSVVSPSVGSASG